MARTRATPIQVNVPYKFSIYRTAAYTATASAFTIMPWDTKLYDTGSNVDVTTNKGRFTAPVAGFYFFHSSVQFGTGNTRLIVSIFKNGSEFSRGLDLSYSGTQLTASVTDVLQLAANDYVEIAYFIGSALSGPTNYLSAHFNGFLLSAI